MFRPGIRKAKLLEYLPLWSSSDCINVRHWNFIKKKEEILNLFPCIDITSGYINDSGNDIYYYAKAFRTII